MEDIKISKLHDLSNHQLLGRAELFTNSSVYKDTLDIIDQRIATEKADGNASRFMNVADEQLDEMIAFEDNVIDEFIDNYLSNDTFGHGFDDKFGIKDELRKGGFELVMFHHANRYNSFEPYESLREAVNNKLITVNKADRMSRAITEVLNIYFCKEFDNAIEFAIEELEDMTSEYSKDKEYITFADYKLSTDDKAYYKPLYRAYYNALDLNEPPDPYIEQQIRQATPVLSIDDKGIAHATDMVMNLDNKQVEKIDDFYYKLLGVYFSVEEGLTQTYCSEFEERYNDNTKGTGWSAINHKAIIGEIPFKDFLKKNGYACLGESKRKQKDDYER